MKTSQIYLILALWGGAGSTLVRSVEVSIDPAQLEMLRKMFSGGSITVKPDLSGLSDVAGNTAGSIVEKVITGAMEGFSKVAKSGEFGRQATGAMQDITQQGAGAFAEAMGDPRLRQQLGRGASELTSSLGFGAKQLNVGLQGQVFPEIKNITGGAISSVFNVENAIRVGGPIALQAGLVLAGIYGSRVFWNVLEQRLTNPRPDILLPGSKFGRWDRVNRWWKGYKSPAMIFDQSVKDRLMEIQEKTKNIRDHIRNGKTTTYDNLLLYGKPGTGKTLFAQILADYTDMDFLPVTAASLLQSGVEGIKYFNELLDMANRSKYGVIIFVDEADALFIDRNMLSPESDHYKVLNHILALTGGGSNKFMLVAATNHAYVMDEAMGRRFQDRVLMPVPQADTRLALLELYMGGALFNEKENGKQFVANAKALLTGKVMSEIVQKTAGLSHAEIKDMVVAMRKKAFATKGAMITQAHVRNAVDQAVEKVKVAEEDRIKREQRFAKPGQAQDVQVPVQELGPES